MITNTKFYEKYREEIIWGLGVGLVVGLVVILINWSSAFPFLTQFHEGGRMNIEIYFAFFIGLLVGMFCGIVIFILESKEGKQKEEFNKKLEDSSNLLNEINDRLHSNYGFEKDNEGVELFCIPKEHYDKWIKSYLDKKLKEIDKIIGEEKSK